MHGYNENPSDHRHVQEVEPVLSHSTGHRGRPRKLINSDYLAEATSSKRHISQTQLAKSLKIHRHTLRRNMRSYGIKRTFTALSNDHLDLIVRAYKDNKPDSGMRYLIGYLRSKGIRIQKSRVYASLGRVDGLGRALRQRTAIVRREYHSTRPNALWHCDGHHKLILWGIVIHGFIDGYCRTVSISKAKSTT